MTRRRWSLVVAGGVAVAVLVGAGVVMAQTPTPGSGSGPSFLDRVAQKLGIESSKLQDAVNSAANDQINEELQNGDLTQQQADKLKERIANGQGPWFKGPATGRGHGEKGVFAFGLGFPGIGDAAAKLGDFLGISADQLRTELQAQDATLATVASNHGKTRDELKTFISDTAKSQLDQAVANGKLTQQQEDNILTSLQSHLDGIIDGSLPPFFGRMHGRFGHGPDNDNDSDNNGTPTAESTPAAGTDFGTPQFDTSTTTSALRG